MRTKDYLNLLKNEIHTTVMATVDQDGHPVTRVIDVMLVDDTTFYFITAKGKEFYRQLMDQQFVAVSGACGGEGMDKKEASIHMKAVSIRGKIQNIGNEKLEEVFEKNPYMKQIYPSAASRMALEVFCMTEGEGEFFDLSTKPITRESFAVGTRCSNSGKEPEGCENSGYWITDACIGCGSCAKVCPQACIIAENGTEANAGTGTGNHTGAISRGAFSIRREHCLHCGNCLAVCPVGAVKKG